MTTKEFFDFASKQLYFKDCTATAGSSREKLDRILHELCPVPFNSSIILDFLCDIDCRSFYRAEKSSGDILLFNMGLLDLTYLAKSLLYFDNPIDGVSYWSDIGSVAACCAEIKNCSGVIEYIFITEDGRFYNDKHCLKANFWEELFDYFASVEYNYRRPIHTRTYEYLSAAGWPRKNAVDLSDLYKTFCDNGIILTEKQLDFIREFSGFRLSFTNSSEKIKSVSSVFRIDFLSVERLISEDPQYDKEIHRPGYVNRNVIRVGELFCDMYFYLNSEVILLDDRYYPMGHTVMECIDHLFDYVPANTWLESTKDFST
ncbi:MAG: hypothetical protein NC299_15980 [Lachnospiraceae bacterium]|nr:hypothetical protein [Ruminococcus sp.]MCM1276834.1 hypothetical protein [Lachnospiraceae bacterium]